MYEQIKSIKLFNILFVLFKLHFPTTFEFKPDLLLIYLLNYHPSFTLRCTGFGVEFPPFHPILSWRYNFSPVKTSFSQYTPNSIVQSIYRPSFTTFYLISFPYLTIPNSVKSRNPQHCPKVLHLTHC